MARGREAMAKRNREKVRQERQEAKRLKRESAAASDDAGLDPEREIELMDEFRRLSEKHAAGQMSEAVYASERTRIFEELGIEE